MFISISCVGLHVFFVQYHQMVKKNEVAPSSECDYN